MKKKVFLYSMALVIIGILVTGFYTSHLTQTLYKHEVQEKLKNTASLIQYQITEDIKAGRKPDYNTLAARYAEILDKHSDDADENQKTWARVTFIAFNGKVLGESETNYNTMENHLNRKEVQQAIRGEIGEDIRFSHTLKLNLLYIALPIQNADVVARVSVPLIQIDQIDRAIWKYTFLGMILGLLLTALLALKFSSSITNPVYELITVSGEIAKGNYSKRVRVNSGDELGKLAETFNEMAQELEKTVADQIDKNMKMDSIMDSMTDAIVAVDSSYRVVLINSIARKMFDIESESEALGNNIMEVIRNHPINSFLRETIEYKTSLVNEITIGSPVERILRVYTNPIKSKQVQGLYSGGIVFIQDITNIKKLEQIRTEFVSNVTHELKTPLTSIRGFIETLRTGAVSDRNVADRFLEIIDIEAERLYMLINDILQLSEIESKQSDANIETYPLRPIISETFSILEGAAEKKGIKLEMNCSDDITIVANRNRIKQMLINLIDNGIKYNVENGAVLVKAAKAEGKLALSVKDTGIGIPAEHIPRIFERFYRVDKGRSRSMGGTGLGLSIVKHIVNLYSGDIKVFSEPGKGTEFVILFPM